MPEIDDDVNDGVELEDDDELENDEDDSGDDDDDTADARTFTQQQLNRILAEEKRRIQSQFADYDDIRERANQFDLLTEAAKTDTEIAVQDARDDAWNAAMTTVVPRLVRSEFRAAAKGVLSAEQLSALLEDLDLLRYATDEGAADEEKIARKVAALAPAGEKPRRASFPDLGAGKRGGAAKSVNMNDVIRHAAGYDD